MASLQLEVFAMPAEVEQHRPSMANSVLVG
jgi:hypothetical protein